MRQILIDFCESMMFQAQDIGGRRAKKYGSLSWQWRVTYRQEVFWGRLGYKILVWKTK